MIEVQNLRKRYGHILAVDGVGFQVSPGEVLGLLGPNGAGKSTTMKMIAGFVAPSEGSARVCGFDVITQPLAVRRALGYLPEGAPCYGEMTTRGFLAFVAAARGLRGPARRVRLDAVIARLTLGSVLGQTVDTLSKGFRRRVCLAAAIVHDPPALILDEPTDGLDPNQKHEVRGLIREMARERTIVISTHILEEVQAVCTRALIIAHGRLRADATPAELERRSRYFGAVSFAAADSVTAMTALQGVDGVAAVELDTDGRVLALPRAGRRIADTVAARLRAQGVAFDALREEPGRLDEVFRRITTEPEPERGREHHA